MLRKMLHEITHQLGTPESFQLLAALVLALGLIVFVLIRLRVRTPLWNWVRKLVLLWEPALMLVLVAAALAWPMMLPPPFGCGGQKHLEAFSVVPVTPSLLPLTVEMVGPPAMTACLMLAVLVICFYLFKNRSLFLFMGVLLPAMVFYAFMRWKFFPVLDEIQLTARDSEFWRVFGPKIMISMFYPGVRLYVAGAASVLGGLYCSRGVFAPWKYFLGAFVSTLAVIVLSAPFFAPGLHSLLFQALLFALIARFMLVLPLARRRLESLSGLRLSRDREMAPSRPGTALQWLMGHAALLMMTLVVAASAVVNWAEGETMRMIFIEWRPTYRTHTLQNAYPDLERLFLKKRIQTFATGRLDPPAERIMKVHTDGRDIRDDAYWAGLDHKQLFGDLEQFSPYMGPYRAAAEKDFYEEPDPTGIIAFLPVREVSRQLSVRAQLCIRDGRTTEALEDIRAIIGFGGLGRNHPILVHQMIAVAVRGIGLEAAYEYYVYYRRDAEKLRPLARLLDELAYKWRTSINVEGLRRGEPASLPVATMAEIAIPAFLRAEKNTIMRWLNFEALRVAVNLELYRADHGRYPERLEQLAPDFMRLLPRDPIKGQPLIYRLSGDDFVLDSEGKAGQPFEEMYAFPPPPFDAAKKGKRYR